MKHSLLVLIPLVFASNALATNYTEEIERITVLGVKEPMLDSIQLDDVTNKAAGDLGEQLREFNGVSSGRQGGRGFSPVIRGQQNSQLNVLLDGGIISGACPSGMDHSTSYATVGYDKITVIKGNQSVLYGAGGSGGSIFIERERPELMESGLTGKIDMTATSNSGRRKLSADVATGNDSGYIRIFGSTEQQNDYYQDGDGNDFSSGYNGKNGGIVMGFDLTPDTNVELSYEGVRDRDIFYTIKHAMDTPRADSDSWRFKLTQSINSGPFHTLELNAYSSDVEHLMDDYSVRDRWKYMRMKGLSMSNTSGGKIQGIATLGNAEVTLGMEYLNNYSDGTHLMDNGSEELDESNFRLYALEWPGVRQEEYGTFGEADITLDNKNSMRLGLRIDRNFVEATKADGEIIAYKKPIYLYNKYYNSDTTKVDETNIGAVLGFNHQLDADQALNMYITRSVVSADAGQRFRAISMHGSNWIGNPDLKAETHNQLELGWQQGNAEQNMAVSVFYDKVADYILQYRLESSQPHSIRHAVLQKNVDATLYGMEAELTQPLFENWRFRSSLSLTIGRYNSKGDDYLPQIAPISSVNTLDWHTDNWSAGMSWELAAKQSRANTDSGLDAGKTAGYGLINLFGSYNASKALAFGGGINNLLDKTYALHLNKASDSYLTEAEQVNEPGREFWVNANWKF
ncbi:TonB-dependent receptor [Shewanella psychrophila]|nr:TonB-dependent receptor [Shewanella psychrophila]